MTTFFIILVQLLNNFLKRQGDGYFQLLLFFQTMLITLLRLLYTLKAQNMEEGRHRVRRSQDSMLVNSPHKEVSYWVLSLTKVKLCNGMRAKFLYSPMLYKLFLVVFNSVQSWTMTGQFPLRQFPLG